MSLLPSQSISTPPFSSFFTTSPTGAVELNGAISQLLTRNEQVIHPNYLINFGPRWESFVRSEFPNDSHDQAIMAIGGGSAVGRFLSIWQEPLPPIREPRNYQVEMATPIRGGDSYSNYLQSAGVPLSSGGNLDDPTANIITFEFDEYNFPDKAKPAVHRAFATWQEPLNLRFLLSWMPPGLADFNIGMYSGGYGDSKPFEAGPGGTLAHSNTPRRGHMCFNLDQPWWYDLAPPPQNFYDFQSVAVHQIGRLLGLRYSFDPKSIMFKYIVPGNARRGLTQADRDDLERLYLID